jgi:hypothetical protein
MTNPRASALLAGFSGCEFIEMCTFKCTVSGGSLAIPKVELSKADNLYGACYSGLFFQS